MGSTLLIGDRRKAVQDALLEGRTYDWILSNIHGVSTRDISLVRKEIEGGTQAASKKPKPKGHRAEEEEVVASSSSGDASSSSSTQKDIQLHPKKEEELDKKLVDSDIYRMLGTFDDSEVLEWIRKLLKLIMPLTIRYSTTDPLEFMQKLKEECRTEGMKSCEEKNHEVIAKEALMKVTSEDIAKNRRIFEARAFERAVRYMQQQGGKVPIFSLVRSLLKTPEAMQWLSSSRDGAILLAQLGYIPVSLADLELKKAQRRVELAQKLLSSEMKRPRRSPTDLSIITAEICEPAENLSNSEKIKLEKLCFNISKQKGWTPSDLVPLYS
jgi:hypothetical protein